MITKNSTFEDVHQLLVEKNDLLLKQIEYLKDDRFSKKQSDKGYLARNFHFFMAIVLQGVSSDKKKTHVLNFLHVLYPDEEKTTYESDTTWRRNAGDFVNGNGNIAKELNDKLKEIDLKTPINVFFDGTWYDLKDKKGETIFYNSQTGESVFVGFESQTGKDRAIEKMRQIADFLVNGTQITSNGGFSYMADPYTLLKANKQLILNGAPGTGKTYFARNEIADRLFGISGGTDEEKEKVKRIQMDMVQFHPSYDYTDFIEGIRPDMRSGNIGYTLKNGSFKKFCRRAGVIERIVAAKQNVDDVTIDEFLIGEDDAIRDFWKEEIKKESFDINNLPPFLFIIDEINRAEISKVLGEIMFCLDADYRGTKGMIATQYASLATDESFFISKENDKFFIPSNVYVIGTMNDIDRSVEVFDFALRRRFAWHEMTAESVMEAVLKAMRIDVALGNDYLDYIEKIEVLNKSITSLMKLNRSYYLGPSYFAKIGLYLEGNSYKAAREEVWNNHIAQIMNEYVKGKKTESEIDKIGAVFKA